MRAEHHPKTAVEWSRLCLQCSEPLSEDAEACPACGMASLRPAGEYRAASSWWEADPRQVWPAFLKFFLSIGLLTVVAVGLALAFKHQLDNRPDDPDWFMSEGIYWFIALAVVHVGSILALHLIQYRFTKKVTQLGEDKERADGIDDA